MANEQRIADTLIYQSESHTTSKRLLQDSWGRTYTHKQITFERGKKALDIYSLSINQIWVAQITAFVYVHVHITIMKSKKTKHTCILISRNETKNNAYVCFWIHDEYVSLFCVCSLQNVHGHGLDNTYIIEPLMFFLSETTFYFIGMIEYK